MDPVWVESFWTIPDWNFNTCPSGLGYPKLVECYIGDSCVQFPDHMFCHSNPWPESRFQPTECNHPFFFGQNVFWAAQCLVDQFFEARYVNQAEKLTNQRHGWISHRMLTRYPPMCMNLTGQSLSHGHNGWLSMYINHLDNERSIGWLITMMFDPWSLPPWFILWIPVGQWHSVILWTDISRLPAIWPCADNSQGCTSPVFCNCKTPNTLTLNLGALGALVGWSDPKVLAIPFMLTILDTINNDAALANAAHLVNWSAWVGMTHLAILKIP